MDGCEVCVLEEADEVGLGRLLELADRRRLKPKVSLEVLGDLAYQPLEPEK